jgi:hypothetical protein
VEPFLSQFWAIKETNNKNLCCSQTQKYFCAAQKSLLLFCAVHWNKQKYFDAFSLLWDDTKSTNCPGRAGFAKARYMKSFSDLLLPRPFSPLRESSYGKGIKTKQVCSRNHMRGALSFQTTV